MTDSCSTCRWARPWTPAPSPLQGRTGPILYSLGEMEAIRCVRFPQSVTNAPSYWCGEFAAKDKEAA